MKREASNPDATPSDAQDDARREALDALFEAREKLLHQMTEDIMSNRDIIVDGSHPEGLYGFELQEIEDRYSSRLSSLNALLDNLEYRRPRLEHAVRVVRTTVQNAQRAVETLLGEFEDWDVVGFDVVRLEGESLAIFVLLTSEIYPE